MTEDAFNLVSMYMSISANKTNDVMKILTIFSAYFLPLTFIVGLYGMNFDFRDMLREGGIKRSNFLLGRMYFYQYVPEIPDNTFDMYPLIFILNKTETWFEGINFHFMNPKQRAVLLEHMLDYLNKQDDLVKNAELILKNNKIFSLFNLNQRAIFMVMMVPLHSDSRYMPKKSHNAQLFDHLG